ncbi:ammonium transporter [Conexibacter sp. W3-3-2]|uniref:ammonium transporter n=1 Tax=Conexibacter sp. W3-3-2 TaxID=2675227 RepID=UPI0012B9101F|nr:ammonium transporter [Conexibacter sp. W3-3-2]MTD46850.1 ammonium transporter [Conexibacter sp. W3-3-2]
MRRSSLAGALMLSVLAALIVPAVSMADTLEASLNGQFPESRAINTMWVMVAALLVMLMQVGFMFLEIGFSRGKNAGTIVAKILTNFSIAGIMFWACGFALAFGAPVSDSFNVAGKEGFFLQGFGDPATAFPVLGIFDVTVETKFFFQFVFCAVSLAIVWGSTLERIKFGVYIIYGIVFAGLIYPLGAHWVFGGGFLQNGDYLGLGLVGMQDFAGSTAVHLIGATGALAALLLLGPRKGKYGPDGKPRAIPGHNMPLFGLSVLILWFGWFGFNGGTALSGLDGRYPEIILITNLAAGSGVLGALLMSKIKMGTLDIGMAGNGAIGALVAITAPSGYVEAWTAPIIGVIAGLLVPICVIAIDKKVDDPVGVLTAHGICGIWGTLACGIFTAPRLAQYNAFGDPNGGLIYSGSFDQLLAQVVGLLIAFSFVFLMSYGTFWLIKKTYGLRVTEAEEDAGLDISEHGMYGYPEQFIPSAELVGYGAAPAASAKAGAPIATTKEATA